MQFYVALLIVATAVPLSTQQRRERRGRTLFSAYCERFRILSWIGLQSSKFPMCADVTFERL